MSVFEAAVLGLVQGLTEFIPISSSGHLVIVPALLGWQQPPVSFDVFLHGATLLAVLIYFRRELSQLAKGIRRPGAERRLAFFLLIGTIPAGLAGLLLEESVGRFFSRPQAVALLLLGTGSILLVSEFIASRSGRAEGSIPGKPTVESLSGSVTASRALTIGAGQAIAILPGFSRSGLTIGAGLLTGLDRTQAARFSFLLAIPILAGATVVQIPDLVASDVGAGAIVAGGMASLASSYLAVAGMIGYLQRRGLHPFALYCFVAGPIYALILG